MKRKVTATILTAVITLGVATPVYAAETANPTSSAIYVDGEKIDFEAYNINGNNYFKLRDVAWALSGTDTQFNVTWNDAEGVINLISGEDYGKNGQLSVGNGKVKSATLNTAPIMKDSSYVSMTAYNIEGNNFFKLRDLGEQFDFAVGWDGEANAVTIDTDDVVEKVKENAIQSKPENSATVGQDNQSTQVTGDVESTGQTWIEGEKHGIPKVGDTVIKKDGTKVVLTSTNFHGYEVLAWGQGVDAIKGTTINGVTVRGENGKYCGAWSGYGAGNDISLFRYDPVSGEVHTENEWAAIASYYYPEEPGTHDGEMRNTYFKWHAGGERWMWMGPKF